LPHWTTSSPRHCFQQHTQFFNCQKICITNKLFWNTIHENEVKDSIYTPRTNQWTKKISFNPTSYPNSPYQSSKSSHPTKLGQSKIFQQLWLVNMDLLDMDCNTISEKRFFQTWNKYPKQLQPWEHQKKEKKNLSRKSFKESSDAYLISRAGWVPSLLAILHLSKPFQSGPIPSMSTLGKKNTESNCTWR
jgi:hypothetical protein